MSEIADIIIIVLSIIVLSSMFVMSLYIFILNTLYVLLGRYLLSSSPHKNIVFKLPLFFFQDDNNGHVLKFIWHKNYIETHNKNFILISNIYRNIFFFFFYTFLVTIIIGIPIVLINGKF